MNTLAGHMKSKPLNFTICVKKCHFDKSDRILKTKNIRKKYALHNKSTKEISKIDEAEYEHIIRVLKSEKKDDKLKTSIRKNEMNIQMISERLYRQIYGHKINTGKVDPDLVSKAQDELKKYGLWKEENTCLEEVSLNLPPLKGKNIEEHFQNIGEEQSGPYRKILISFMKNGIPKPPDTWLLQKGWTKYVTGKEPVSVPFPDDKALVFDVEVCIKLGELPTLATAVSENAWYGWVSSDLVEGINPVPTENYSTDKLIPLEGKTLSKEIPRIIVGHNISYDRARIKEQYYLKNSGIRFLDTMSLHICIGGISKQQKTMLKRKIEDEVESWKAYSCFSSLKQLYSLYCDKDLIKEIRNVFIEGTLQDVKNNFAKVMNYCSDDVKATFEVLQAIFPVFLKRFPHPVTLAGMLEMGTAFLPVNKNWNRFLAGADQTYNDLKHEITVLLSKKSDDACRLLHNESYKNDLWMWSENWSVQELKFRKSKTENTVLNKSLNEESAKIEEKAKIPHEENLINGKMINVANEEKEEDKEYEELTSKFQYLFDLGQLLYKKKPFLPGYPLWYRKLCEKPDTLDWIPNAQLNTTLLVTPLLLNLTWEKFPLFHTHEFGWGILVADIEAENVKTSVPFQKLKELTQKNCQNFLDGTKKKIKEKNDIPVPYYKGSGVWCNHIVDDCCYFFKLPHKLGNSKNVGNPLSKDFSNNYSNNTLIGSDHIAEKVLELAKKLSYWRNNRERISNQFVVWLNKRDSANGLEEDIPIGVILPKVVVCGTLTRRAMEATWLTASKTIENRIGSELRSMIQAPPGYHIIGADVDSQELWIASLIGDSCRGKIHGSTPFGWMTLSGTKADKTDLHSVTAKAAGISREHAKVINYARIYGAGVSFAQKLLQQFNPSMSPLEARSKAVKMYSLTKGRKLCKIKKNLIPHFKNIFGSDIKVYDVATAYKLAHSQKKKFSDIFEEVCWVDGTESEMFNELEKIANSPKPVTPFLQCRLSRALEPKFKGDNLYNNTRINWVVQSGAVDFLHLMLVCMRWLTKGQARYCFSFHDEVRYLIPSEERYNGALAMHITNLFVRTFCAYRLGMYDLPQSVAFFSSVEVDKTLRKEADDDCVTPSNPHGMEKGYGIGPGESLNIYQAIEKSGGSLFPFNGEKIREILKADLELPAPNQKIVRVVGSKGNNLHEVKTPESTTFLVSMPSKFRKTVWIKKGDYILVEPIEEGGKVKAEMQKVLTPIYIDFLKKENVWPAEFSNNEKKESRNELDDLFENINHNILINNESSNDSE